MRYKHLENILIAEALPIHGRPLSNANRAALSYGALKIACFSSRNGQWPDAYQLVQFIDRPYWRQFVVVI